jgi:nicotinic acid mononucleotide adenylyltransferase
MHLQVFDTAAKFLRENFSLDCLAGFLSPSADVYVRHKLGPLGISFEHRREMCDLSCRAHTASPDAIPVYCDAWEGSQDGFVDFPRVRSRLAGLIEETFPTSGLIVLYLCGADHFVRCRLANWTNCVAIARPPYAVKTESNPERGIYVCKLSQEGYAKLFENVSSTEIRRRLTNQESLTGLVYPDVERYLRDKVAPLMGWEGGREVAQEGS